MVCLAKLAQRPSNFLILFLSRMLMFPYDQTNTVEDNVQSSLVQLQFSYSSETSRYLLCFDEICGTTVGNSSHFGNEITLARNYRGEDRMEHIDASIRQCMQNGISKNKLPSARSAITLPFCFASQSGVGRIGACILTQYSDLLIIF
jgi:hypothetical protein